jgi:membrane associated rhomboid family serine protease
MFTRYQNKRYKIRLGDDNNALTWLIIVNAVIFVLLKFVWVFYLLQWGKEAGTTLYVNQVYAWLAIPPDFSLFLQRPWTIITHFFLADSTFTLIANLLWIWTFGFILQDLSGNGRIFPLYLYGGFIGALIFLLIHNLVPTLRGSTEFFVDGAGASIFCMAVASTTLSPDFRFFKQLNGGIPVWVIAVIYAAISLATITSKSPVYLFSFTAAGLFGFMFITLLNRGKDLGYWMHAVVDRALYMFDPKKKELTKFKGKDIFYQANREPYIKKANLSQAKLDDILDKINDVGYENLSADEKEFLRRISQDKGK